MFEIINNWVHTVYWEGVSGIFGVISVMATVYLTFYIIKQTNQLSKQQAALELRISSEQCQLQKRQLRIDIFPYRREIYLNLFKVIEFTVFLEKHVFTLDLKEKSAIDIYKLYKLGVDNYLGDTKSILVSLMEAEYILPSNISPTVNEINARFDSLCSKFMIFETLEEVITQCRLNDTKDGTIKLMYDDCKYINSKAHYLKSIILRELDISSLDD